MIVYGDNAWIYLVFLVALYHIPYTATFNAANTKQGMYEDLANSMHHALIRPLLVKVNALT